MRSLRLFLCGDVMTGRGVDQILPYPCNPVLYEAEVRDARVYVQLAEQINGPIPHPVDFAYVWGDALTELEQAQPDWRIVNLETSITTHEHPWPDKEIHYRMNPRNIECLTAARINCCVLANNHVLDWGHAGLLETLQTLSEVGLAYSGAGKNLKQAQAPAILEIPGKERVLVFGLGSTTSGIPREWSAADDRPGVFLLPDLSEATAEQVAQFMLAHKQPGDVLIASLHWGANWGYDIPDDQVRFAHRLIEAGVDVIHGHSSHHAKGIEVYRNKLILYGCGDFVNDYEGIGSYAWYRGDLAVMYLADLNPDTGELVQLCLVPFQARRLRLTWACADDVRWLAQRLNESSHAFATRLRIQDERHILLG
ncbi:MAG: CapA family protein [Gemmatales bacterium]|nr:CapA family protein [Gemmatales bacterium]MCS7161568.1 CapA family protein [Gemmatales bacterium]MDW8176771.1 CapA family protein [Gemmatales bacterium]MDW8221482.1 CapA family protein [Gemmatales bacterium]